MDKCVLIIQASTQRATDSDRVISREASYIPINLNLEMCEDFKLVDIDLPHIQTTKESGRLMVFKECDFLHATGNISCT
eukprot:362960-Chlamydomonas_euryale.AAC.1